MSMSPNNPFEDDQNDQGDAQSSAPAKSRKGCLIGCSIAGILALLVCCGGVVLLMRGGGQMLADFMNTALSSEYQRQLAGNPVIVEHIGEIVSLDFDLSTTFEEAQKSAERGEETHWVFKIEGSKGSGTLIVQQDTSGGGTDIKSATLVMPDGTRHSIDVSATPAVEELEFDLSDMIDAGEIDTATGDTDAGDTDAGDIPATPSSPAEEN